MQQMGPTFWLAKMKGDKSLLLQNFSLFSPVWVVMKRVCDISEIQALGMILL